MAADGPAGVHGGMQIQVLVLRGCHDALEGCQPVRVGRADVNDLEEVADSVLVRHRVRAAEVAPDDHRTVGPGRGRVDVKTPEFDAAREPVVQVE